MLAFEHEQVRLVLTHVSESRLEPVVCTITTSQKTVDSTDLKIGVVVLTSLAQGYRTWDRGLWYTLSSTSFRFRLAIRSAHWHTGMRCHVKSPEVRRCKFSPVEVPSTLQKLPLRVTAAHSPTSMNGWRLCALPFGGNDRLAVYGGSR